MHWNSSQVCVTFPSFSTKTGASSSIRTASGVGAAVAVAASSRRLAPATVASSRRLDTAVEPSSAAGASSSTAAGAFSSKDCVSSVSTGRDRRRRDVRVLLAGLIFSAD